MSSSAYSISTSCSATSAMTSTIGAIVDESKTSEKDSTDAKSKNAVVRILTSNAAIRESIASMISVPSKEEEMVRINTEKDAKKFQGRIVAYTTDTEYYKADNPFSIESSKGVMFAIVAERYKISLYRVFLKSRGSSAGAELSDGMLSKNSLKMRFATDSEVDKIGKAYTNGEAKFEHRDLYTHEINAIFLNIHSDLDDLMESGVFGGFGM